MKLCGTSVYGVTRERVMDYESCGEKMAASWRVRNELNPKGIAVEMLRVSNAQLHVIWVITGHRDILENKPKISQNLGPDPTEPTELLSDPAQPNIDNRQLKTIKQITLCSRMLRMMRKSHTTEFFFKNCHRLESNVVKNCSACIFWRWLMPIHYSRILSPPIYVQDCSERDSLLAT